MKKIIKWLYLSQFFNIFKLFGVNTKRIIFSSFYGKQYSGDPKVLYETLHSINNDEYEYIWVLNSADNTNLLSNTKTVSRYSLKHLYYLATSKYRIDNCQESKYLKPHKNTVYLQTWHGTPLKKIAQDIEDSSFDEVKQDWEKDSSYWTYLLSSSTQVSKLLSKAFLIDEKKIITLGYPRNDMLMNVSEEVKDRIFKKVGISTNKKVILYAPTFRDDAKDFFSIKLTLDNFISSLSDDYILMIRMHTNIKNKSSEIFDKKNIYDVSLYDDIQELYTIADILVRYYSSVFFDYSLLQKPIIFYAYDLEKYKNVLRGFYYDYESLPGVIVQSEDELYTCIKNIQNYNYNKLNDFNHRFNEFQSSQSTLQILKKVGLI